MQTVKRLNSTRLRKKHDFYETPKELCRDALLRLVQDEPSLGLHHVLDAGAGNGVWGNEFMQLALNLRYYESTPIPVLVGIDSEIKRESLPPYDSWVVDDYLKYQDAGEYGLIFGNPPYSLAEEFVRKSMDLVEDYGHVYFLLRLAFLESKKRYFGLFEEFPPKTVYVLSRRPSFFSTKDGRKTTDALSYAMFLWQKGNYDVTELDWLYWDYD